LSSRCLYKAKTRHVKGKAKKDWIDVITHKTFNCLAAYEKKKYSMQKWILIIPTQREEMLLKPEKGTGHLFIRKRIIIFWRNIHMENSL
jgi:hypothetical protein